MEFFFKILFILVSALFLSCTDRMSPEEFLPNVNCAKNEDCALVDTGCCGCKGKDGAMAVHKSLVAEYAEYREKIKQECSSDFACTTDNVPCEWKAVCVNSKCTTTLINDN